MFRTNNTCFMETNTVHGKEEDTVRPEYILFSENCLKASSDSLTANEE